MTLYDIRRGLRQYLLDDASIAAIVSDRVYHVRMPQGNRLPCIVFTRISDQPDNHMQGPSGLAKPRVQVDSWAVDGDTAAQLADLVKERLDGSRGQWLWGEDSPEEALVVQGVFPLYLRDYYDDDSQMYRVGRDYFIWFAER